jgi:hypothetical protein
MNTGLNTRLNVPVHVYDVEAQLAGSVVLLQYDRRVPKTNVS